MDLKQTGKFIQELRKSKELTQSSLALKLGVSEKTVSKWECGNGFPDTTLVLPLCNELGISANELLSARKIESDKEYKEIAEDNLVMLKGMQEKNTKLLLMLEWPIGILSIICLFGCVLAGGLVEMAVVWRVLLIVAGFAVFCFGIYFALLIETKAGFYECKKCHHKYVPTYGSVLGAMHMGRNRYMKCPKCGEKSWQKKRIKGE